MAKTVKKTAAKSTVNSGTANTGSVNTMKNFEQRLERLELLGERIRKTDIPLDEALAAFEEGIKLARTLEKDLDKIDSRIEILINSADAPADLISEDGLAEDDSPELELFDSEE